MKREVSPRMAALVVAVAAVAVLAVLLVAMSLSGLSATSGRQVHDAGQAVAQPPARTESGQHSQAPIPEGTTASPSSLTASPTSAPTGTRPPSSPERTPEPGPVSTTTVTVVPPVQHPPTPSQPPASTPPPTPTTKPATPPAKPSTPATTPNKPTCATLITSVRPAYAPGGPWKIVCVDSIPPSVKKRMGWDEDDVAGWTDFQQQQISILSNGRIDEMRQAIAHEWAHAESASWTNGDLSTAYWVKLLGYTPATAQEFWSEKRPYAMQPAERWAETRSRCAGFTFGEPVAKLASCTTVEQLEQYRHEQEKQQQSVPDPQPGPSTKAAD